MGAAILEDLQSIVHVDDTGDTLRRVQRAFEASVRHQSDRNLQQPHQHGGCFKHR